MNLFKNIKSNEENPNSPNPDGANLIKTNISWMRYGIVVIILFIILGLNIRADYLQGYKQQIYDSFTDYLVSLHAVEDRSKTIKNLDKLYSYYDEEYAKLYNKAVRLYVNKYGLNRNSLNIISEIDSKATLFLTKKPESGIYYDANGNRLQLSEEQIRDASENCLVIDNKEYDMVECMEGAVLVEWDITRPNITVGRVISDICEGDAFVYNTKLNTITYADDESLVDAFSDFTIEEMLSDVPNHAENVQLGKVYLNPGNIYLGYGVSKKIDEEQVLCTYFTESEVKSSVISKILFQSIFKIIFVLYFVVCIYFFMKYSFEIENRTNYIKIGKNTYINKSFLSKALSVTIVGILLFSIFTYYVNNLVYYCRQNIDASNDLSFLQKNIENNEEDRSKLVADFHEMAINYAHSISVFLAGADNTEGVDVVFSLNELKNLIGLDEISVYDANGVIIDTTTNYSGYVISNSPESNEHCLWNLLNGGSFEECYTDDTDNSRLYAAVRRIDSPGLIKIGTSNYAVQNILNAVDFEQSVIDSDSNSTAKGYIKTDDESKLYLVYSGSNKVNVLDNPFVETSVMNNGYAGTQKINGGLYYLNVVRNEDYYLINFEDISKVKLLGISDTMSDVGIIIFITMVIILSMMFEHGYSTKPDEKESDKEYDLAKQNENKLQLQKTLRFSLNMLLLISMLCLAGFLVGTNMQGNNSFISYIFNGNWDKGINIFSATSVIMILFLTVIVIVAEKKIIRLLSDSLGTKSATAGYLVSSVLKVIIICVSIFYSLLQMGIDTSTLLASLGIGGLILGMGAKDIIADLLAGIFLVFEGHVCIGEWITVGDFHGTVTDIGIRTTKVTDIGGKIKSIPNSEMKNITNFSRSLSYVGIMVYLDKNVDLNLLKEIIDKNEGRFRKNSPEIKEKPQYSYVEDITRDGVQVVISTKCDEGDLLGVKKKFRETIFEILRENNLIQDGVSVKIINND